MNTSNQLRGWGFIGTEHAWFKDFVTAPAEVIRNLKETLQHKARRDVDHNPAGGWMILLLTITLLISCSSGIVLYAIEDQAGPLDGTFLGSYKHWEDFFESVHETFANLNLLLLFIHIGGVMVESLIHRENLVRAMWNGYKPSPHL